MKLYFYGADKEVTGSCHCLELGGKRILFDCGLQQGGDTKDNGALPFAAGEIDLVFVTHAHVDHSGRLPLLVKNGYKGEIYATRKTCELLRIMLMDSARIQEQEAVWRQRKKRRAGDPEEEALYTVEDAQAAIDRLVPCSYGDVIEHWEGFTTEWFDAGHLLGSANILVTATEEGETRTLIFSGDIGNKNQPIIRDPQPLPGADYVLMESTYGDRDHKADDHMRTEELARVIDETLRRGGNVVIPSFAVGRTQELLFHIREMKERYLVKSVPDFPVYVDSPLAMEATQIYDGDLTGYADAETVEIIKNGFRPLHFSNLHLCRSAEESMQLNNDPTPKVIISSSGMCEAGRIRHHLKHNLWRRECSIVFVGYQANGTLGRLIVDGVSTVKLFGENIAVQAHIVNLHGMSAHADRGGLMEWIQKTGKKPGRVIVVHGEEEAARTFTAMLEAAGFAAYLPNYLAVYDLIADACIDPGVEPDAQRSKEKAMRKASPAYQKLLTAGDRLQEVIRRNEGGANKDLNRFTEQLMALIEKWDR